MRGLAPALRAALLLAGWVLAPPAQAADLTLAQPAVVDARIQLTFQLQDAFDQRLVARLDSGLPTGFTYRFVVMRDRKHWWDAKLEETTLEVVAMYNAVGNEYLVNFKQDGRMVESRLARNRAELEAAMSRFERVPLFAAEGLPRGERLLVKGRAELGTRTLFSFIPVDIETDWAESRKFRLP
jgi:hypothetical protein